ncbi:MAG: twin-arginine translocation signal domain-containing protein [candidate division Zixibacteria bacterium]|nr:twin-arginine translocation signal domain-containing protein [candidate division Zixibacteria bacterium]
MKRRDFIKTTALVGAGLAVGLPGSIYGQPASPMITTAAGQPQFIYPRGGCTDAGIALFDKGPYGKDPFRIFE